jgi:tetratricopeptide (TPR) repeat protein
MEGRPVGLRNRIRKEQLKGYIPCEDSFKKIKDWKEKRIEQHIESGDSYFRKKEYFSAENEYNQVLMMDQNHLKANLGKGKSLYARREKEKAKKIFNNILAMNNLYEKENRNFLAEFGIELFKMRLFDELISVYQKAISIDPDDETLYYNLGKAYIEKGDLEKGVNQLRIAIEKNPNFNEAKELLKNFLSN